MKLSKCPTGHFFDADVYTSCPHCSGESQPNSGAIATGVSSNRSGQSGGPRSVTPISVQPMSVTQPLQLPDSEEPAARQAQPAVQSPPPAPLPLANAVSAAVKYDLPGETQKTIGFYDFGGDEPVVGWLVCVKGEHHGQSFQLKAGQNLIGRDLKMDVALTKDGSVSRNRHAVIMFDPKNAKFYIQQGENGLIYLDRELILLPTQMNPRALVGIGSGEYLLVPLCGDGFSWDDYKE